MNSKEMNERQAELKRLIVDGWKKHRVRDDATVEDYQVETFIGIPMPCISSQFGTIIDVDFNYVEFVVDDGGSDRAIRIPFAMVLDWAAEIKARLAAEAELRRRMTPLEPAQQEARR